MHIFLPISRLRPDHYILLSFSSPADVCRPCLISGRFHFHVCYLPSLTISWVGEGRQRGSRKCAGNSSSRPSKMASSPDIRYLSEAEDHFVVIWAGRVRHFGEESGDGGLSLRKVGSRGRLSVFKDRGSNSCHLAPPTSDMRFSLNSR